MNENNRPNSNLDNQAGSWTDSFFNGDAPKKEEIVKTDWMMNSDANRNIPNVNVNAIGEEKFIRHTAEEIKEPIKPKDNYFKEDFVRPDLHVNNVNGFATKRPSVNNFDGTMQQDNIKKKSFFNPDNVANNGSAVSILFILVILIGGGVFFSNLFFPKMFNPDEDYGIVQIEDSSNKSGENYMVELKRLCSLVDANGNYYSEMTGDINNIDYMAENAKYCSNNTCKYTENGVYHSMSCSSELDMEYNMEDAKVMIRIENACSSFRAIGSYNDGVVSCSENMCSAYVNERIYMSSC